MYKKIIKSGKIQDNWLVDFPQHILTTKNKIYSVEVNNGFIFKLVIPNLNANYNFTLPLATNYKHDFIINWGDNNVEHITGKNLISHTYQPNKTYTVVINGNCRGFYAYSESINYWQYLTDIISWGSTNLIYLNYGFYNATSLSGLPNKAFCYSAKTANHCFENCTKLTTLPDNFYFSNNILDIQYMFKGCTSLKEFPENSILPQSLKQDKINGLFQRCTSLTHLSNKLFKNNLDITNLDYFCENCTSLTSLPDNFTLPNTISSLVNTFNNCTQLLNLPTTLKFPENLLNLENFCKNCIKLTEIPSTIWPEHGFTEEAQINIHHAFNNCYNVTGTVPQYKLWNANINWTPEEETGIEPYTFKYCSGLTNYKYIPTHWGGKNNYEKYNATDIEIEITDVNEIFKLPIHRTYQTYNYEASDNIPLTSGAEYDFTIDWGDGVSSEIKCDYNTDNFWITSENINPNDNQEYLIGYPLTFLYSTINAIENEKLKKIVHKYSAPGKYIISISGQIDTLYVHKEDTTTWKNLSKIYSINDSEWESFENSFCNAFNLTSIANMALSNEKIYNTSYMFYNCKKIKTIPIKFSLHKNLINMSYMFYNCFSEGSNFIEFKSTILPTNRILLFAWH